MTTPRALLCLLLLHVLSPLFAAEPTSILKATEQADLEIEMGWSLYRVHGQAPERLVVTMPLPVTNTYQSVTPITNLGGNPSLLTVRTYPESGEEYLWFRFFRNSLADTRQYVASFSFEITMYGLEADFGAITELYPYRQSAPTYRLYTKYDGDYIQPKNGRIERLARDIQAEDDVDFARQAFERVCRSFKLCGEPGLKPLATVFDNNCGNAETLCSVFISMCRNRGIPARHVAGIDLSGNNRTFAEFYLEEYGWIPADVGLGVLNGPERHFGRIAIENAVVVTSHGIDLTVQGLQGETHTMTQMHKGWYRASRYHPANRKINAREAKWEANFFMNRSAWDPR